MPGSIYGGENSPHPKGEERGLMLAEMNHRSKNIMQSVAGSLSLMAARSKSEEARDVLNGAAARMRAMAEAYAILYRGMGEAVPVGAYLQRLCDGLLQMLDGREIAIRVAGDNPHWPEAVASDIGMIVSEAVLNSLKHGYPAGFTGAIDVELENGPDGWLLAIGDDGTGFDGANVPRGLGSELIEAFARHLSGKVEWTSRLGGGTLVQVRFPAPAQP